MLEQNITWFVTKIKNHRQRICKIINIIDQSVFLIRQESSCDHGSIDNFSTITANCGEAALNKDIRSMYESLI